MVSRREIDPVSLSRLASKAADSAASARARRDISADSDDEVGGDDACDRVCPRKDEDPPPGGDDRRVALYRNGLRGDPNWDRESGVFARNIKKGVGMGEGG